MDTKDNFDRESIPVMPETWDTSKPRPWYTYRGAKRQAHFRSVRMHPTWRITNSIKKNMLKKLEGTGG